MGMIREWIVIIRRIFEYSHYLGQAFFRSLKVRCSEFIELIKLRGRS